MRSGGAGRTLSMNTDLVPERWECVCKLAYSEREEKDFRGPVLVESVTVSRRIKGCSCSQEEILPFFSQKKAFILRCSQEASVNPQAGVSYLLGGFLGKGGWPSLEISPPLLSTHVALLHIHTHFSFLSLLSLPLVPLFNCSHWGTMNIRCVELPLGSKGRDAPVMYKMGQLHTWQRN